MTTNMFKSIHSNDRLSDKIVDMIKEAIFTKRLNPGDKLPSERILVENFQASRVTVREALRILQYLGYLEIKRGSEGGAYILDIEDKCFNNYLVDMFLLGKIKASDVTESRLAVEPLAIRKATKNVNDKMLESLEQNIQKAEDYLKEEKYADARMVNLEFHRILGEYSGNPVLYFMIDSIIGVIQKYMLAIRLNLKSQRQTIAIHKKIHSALKNGNSEEAEKLVREHIAQIQRSWEIY